MKHKNRNFILPTVFITLGIIAVALSFLFGIHWQGTLGDWKLDNDAITALTCYGNNNLTETFSTNCYVLPKQEHKPFVYTTQLSCHVLTNHQFDVTYDTPLYAIDLIKADYVQFSLTVDEQNGILERSNTGGEMAHGPYIIMENDDVVLHAMRKTVFERTHPFEDIHEGVYEYITLSKKTGRGIRAWVNVDFQNAKDDGVVSDFFYCE